MSAINKELYDALIEANVSDKKATAAAMSESSVREDIADMKTHIAVIEARLALAEKLQWGILLGVVGLLIKAFFAT
jgi:hypothetical protein